MGESGWVKGSCLCGEVQFRIEFPTKWCAHCHCELCRRAHSAAFVTWVGVPQEQFEITQGSEHLRSYASSADARRSFCERCGTQLLFESARWAGEIHVARAALEGELDRDPAAHAYYDRHPSWMGMRDDLPKLGGESGTEPLPSADRASD